MYFHIDIDISTIRQKSKSFKQFWSFFDIISIHNTLQEIILFNK